MPNKLFIIGIDKYKHQDELNCCEKDVLDFKNILLEKFDFAENNIYELINAKATNKNIQDAFKGYVKELTSEDNLIIYFSGHGNYDSQTNKGYWVPVNGEDYTTWISNETLISYLDNIKAKHIFVISDSCFSNSILITENTKSTNDYLKYDSRWALTSAFEHAMDSEKDSNTLFAEVILTFLENSTQDIRVSELIEEVKRNFLVNLLQKPQGYPLHVKGHKGGEFVFKIKQSIDNRNLKGYLEFKNILKLYRRNSIFTETKTYEDRTNKIGFQLFQEIDNVIKNATFYLYLYEGINQTKTFKYLNENYPNIFKDKKLLIFIPKEKDQLNIELRKKNIKDKFKPINIFYIDDFIREQCTPRIINEDSSKFLNISNFIEPIFNSEIEEVKNINFIKNWFDKDDEPILVIKGSGGIGKTTFSQYVADKAIIKNPNISVLFIDSLQIKDSLLKNKQKDELKLYNFYEALFDVTDIITEKLSEEVFKINIDAGNILIIIDGLDEVISKIPYFNVSSFLNSIKESSNELGGGKVIITCRTFFWDKVDFSDNEFNVIELEPFNKTQTIEFFNKSFNFDKNKTKKGLKLAEDFKYPGTENELIYHPYVLDIIRSIIENEKETLELDLSNFSSKILKNNIKNDYIIFRVCDREIKRVGQISVDDQITFFIYLAVEKRGFIKTENFKIEIENAIKRKIDDVNVEAFKSHPFLKHFDTSTSFKYDFLADLFRSIYVSSYFDYSSSISEVENAFLEVIDENCWFGSALNQDIVNRTSHWNENDVLLVSDILNQINKNENIKINRKRKMTANIFNLCLSIMHKEKSNNIDFNTLLMKDLFENTNNNIENLSIININADQNIKFNFSDLTISNSIIDNFSTFWDCTFNENTKFYKCHLLNLKISNSKTTINKSNILDCTFDNDVESSLNILDDSKISKTEQIKSFLSSFFHLFISNGRLGRQWEDKVILARYSGINKYKIDYKKLIKVLKRNDVLTITSELGRNKFEIKDSFKEETNKFIKDGTLSNKISAIIKELCE
ncbi:caspase family protein [Flavobacterium psychrophilum]|uniref:NACHT domain-containing protein n=1 Tax=Flavobacterium psychrophilum TaxID=96345 RepID=UPI001C8F8C62|nr:NACHT domain-containing protein [Flavobacterium psychrophilum]EKT4499934.1 caspase family protein [Flavobacterium psychrophilum]ELM3651471.1 caspase family protein [Flavobacterium psychrophilum]ELM3672494.1 caspase family protein [Flavobacterium psychrophilum]ELM3727013.1 caspase family protein [Flavobacterium psychrophilum]QZK98803.1 caspase family protein [Flavobacterium psychrophilum]